VRARFVRTCVQVVRSQIEHHRELRGQQIAIDLVADAAVQGREYGAVRVHAGHQVGDGHGDFCRHRVARRVHQSAHRGGDTVVTGPLVPRAFGPVTGYRTEHQLRVDLAQVVVSHAVSTKPQANETITRLNKQFLSGDHFDSNENRVSIGRDDET